MLLAGIALGFSVPAERAAEPAASHKGRTPAAAEAMANVALPAAKPEGAQMAQAVTMPPAESLKISDISMPEPSLVRKVWNRLGGGKRLSEEDAARYAHIFAFQDVAEFGRADQEIAKLDDRRLLGHVLYQRFMHPDYKSTYAELARWMKQYADHPQAQQVYDLAMRKRPANHKAPAAAKNLRGVWGQHDFDVGQLAQPYLKSRKLSAAEQDTVRRLRDNLAERPTAARKLLDAAHAKSQFSQAEYDALLAEIAESYFYNAKPFEALKLAAASAKRSGDDVPKAGWIAGLSSWKLGEYKSAAKYFEMAAESPRASVWMTAAAAHWAARCHLRAENPREVSKWLARSAEYPRTFYGIISMKMLGMEQDSFNWDMPSFGDRHAKLLNSEPQGKRALALVDAERPDLAELELSRLNPGKNVELQEAMIALAGEGGMPWMAMRMGSAFRDDDERLYDSALYPDVPWSPEKGFEVDKALVYAFIRQESRFDPQARNRSSGAVGLMQIMPATARHVARQSGESIEAERLSDPLVNIDLGQKYLAELLAAHSVDNNLFKLAVAYNAGPGKLARWSKEVSYEDDPLYFIEAIPAAETRMFVERVLTNYWIYRIKFDQDTESLDHVAQGNWPTYVAQDIRRGSRFAAAEGLFSQR